MKKKILSLLLVCAMLLSATIIGFADTAAQGNVKGNLVIVGGALGSSYAMGFRMPMLISRKLQT